MDCSMDLIVGGARSGKSRLAERRAAESGLHKIYLATGEAGDAEMAERIARHRSDRDASWLLAEEPILLADTLRRECRADRCVVVDCLTLWLSNCLLTNVWLQQLQAFFDILPQLEGRIIFVLNEVGLGVVPMGALARRFVDESGFLAQQLATQSQRVTLVVAGLPLALKGKSE